MDFGSPASEIGYTQLELARMPTMKERIDLAVKNAQEQLNNARRAKELFDRNPDLEELMNILQNGRF